MRAVVVGALLLASCGWFEPTLACDHSRLGTEVSCEALLEAAQDRLVGVDGIRELTAAGGVPCPRDAAVSCPDVPAGAVWTVYADLEDGQVLAVRIVSRDGTLHADAPIDMGDMVDP